MMAMVSILDKIDMLLKYNVGDTIRLQYIKESVSDNKRLYDSDRDYVENLTKKYFGKPTIEREQMEEAKTKCWGCGEIISDNSNYCSFCGVKHYQRAETGFVRRNKKFFLLQFISGLPFYQILSIIGGLSGLIPVLYAISRIENVLYSVEYYTGYDISGWTNTLIAGGIVACILSCFVIVIPFIIKKPSKVGRILFFTSFGILVTSVLVGSVGFVLTLISGLIALKSRRY